MAVVSLIYDYVDTHGNNAIKAWLDQQQYKAKAKLNTRLSTLEQINRTEWAKLNVEVLKGDKDGLLAVKVLCQGIQYRLIGYDGPNRGEFTLLACGVERNNRYIPLDIGRQSFARIAEVTADPAGRMIRHDFR
jgi:predicted NACHT family NTPase